MKRRLSVITVLLVLTTLVVATARAEDAQQGPDVWALIPDDADAFLIVNDPTDLAQKVNDFGKAMKIPVPNPIDMLAIQKPEIADAIDFERSAMLVFSKAKKPQGVLVLPVKDFGAFIKAFDGKPTDKAGKPVEVNLFGDHQVALEYQGYALVTDASDAELFDSIKNSKGKVIGQFTALRERLDNADVFVGLTTSGTKLVMTEMRKGMSQIFNETLKPQMEKDGSQGVIDMMSGMLKVADKAFGVIADNVTIVGYTLNIESDAIKLTELARYRDGKFSELLGSIPAPEVNYLEQVPAGQTVVGFAGITPQQCNDAMVKFSRDMMLAAKPVYGMDEKQVDQLMKISKPLMDDMDGMVYYMQIPEWKKAPLYSGLAGQLTIKGDAETYIKQYAKVIRKMKTLLETNESPFISGMEVAPAKVKGRAGLQLTIELDMPAYFKQLGLDMPEQEYARVEKMLESMYGSNEAISIFLAPIDDHTIGFSYVTRRALVRMIEQQDDPAAATMADNEIYVDTFNHFSADTQWFGVLDLTGYMEVILKVIALSDTNGEVPLDMIQSFVPEESCPIALGMAVRANETEAALVVPAVTIRNVVQKVMQGMAQVQQAARQEQFVADDVTKQRKPEAVEEAPVEVKVE